MKQIKLTNNTFYTTLLILFLMVISRTTIAQIDTTSLPITIDAQSTDYEGDPLILKFKKLNLSQGNIKISSDMGQASKLDFENSTWQFMGNVEITLENGKILANKTFLEFTNVSSTLNLRSFFFDPSTSSSFRLINKSVTCSSSPSNSPRQLIFNPISKLSGK